MKTPQGTFKCCWLAGIHRLCTAQFQCCTDPFLSNCTKGSVWAQLHTLHTLHTLKSMQSFNTNISLVYNVPIFFTIYIFYYFYYCILLLLYLLISYCSFFFFIDTLSIFTVHFAATIMYISPQWK